MSALTPVRDENVPSGLTAYDVEGVALAVREAAGVVLSGAWADFDGSWVEVAFQAEDGGMYLVLSPAWVFEDKMGPCLVRDPMRVRLVQVGDGGHIGLLLSAAPVR